MKEILTKNIAKIFGSVIVQNAETFPNIFCMTETRQCHQHNHDQDIVTNLQYS